MVAFEPVGDSNCFLWAADHAVPPITGQEQAVAILYLHSVHLGVRKGRELVELRLLKMDRAVVVWVLVRVASGPSSRVDKGSLERTHDLELFPSTEHTHEVFVFVRVG